MVDCCMACGRWTQMTPCCPFCGCHVGALGVDDDSCLVGFDDDDESSDDEDEEEAPSGRAPGREG